MTETTRSVAPTRALFARARKNTSNPSTAKQHFRSINAGDGQVVSGHRPASPKYHPHTPNHQKNSIFMDDQNGTAKLHGSKRCGNNTLGCSDKGVAPARGGGGKGLFIVGFGSG